MWKGVRVAGVQCMLGQISEELRTWVVEVETSLFCRNNKEGIIFHWLEAFGTRSETSKGSEGLERAWYNDYQQKLFSEMWGTQEALFLRVKPLAQLFGIVKNLCPSWQLCLLKWKINLKYVVHFDYIIQR